MSLNTTDGSRRLRKAATREALLDAARRCLAADSVTTLSVADVSRQAGVAYGTFYVHFASKDELLDELWAELDAELTSALQLVVRRALVQPSRKTLREVASVCLDHWLSHREVLLSLVERAAARSELRLLRDGISPSAARLVEEVVVQLETAQGRDASRARLVAQGLLGMWTRIGVHYVFAEDERPTREQVLDVLVDATLGALGVA